MLDSVVMISMSLKRVLHVAIYEREPQQLTDWQHKMDKHLQDA